MKTYLRDYLSLGILAGAVIALDQLTKAVVRMNLELGEIWMPLEWLAPYARIVHWKNTGAAFGMLQGFGGVFSILALVVAAAILFYYPQVSREEWPLRTAMGLQLGGALGNLIDRLTIGWVTDFLSVGDFPVFNIADASISIGVAVLVIGVWVKERQDRHATPAQTSTLGSSAAESSDANAQPVAEILREDG